MGLHNADKYRVCEKHHNVADEKHASGDRCICSIGIGDNIVNEDEGYWGGGVSY